MRRLLCGLVSLFVLGAAWAEKTAPVTVENTPLPVTVENTIGVNGTVGIAGTPSVQATIIGTPGVTIQNAPDQPIPVSVDPYPRTPFQIAIRMQFPTNGYDVSGSFSVPSGMRLVIETVSIRGGLAASEQLTHWGITVAAGAACTHALNMPSSMTLPDLNTRMYSSNDLVRLYADPGTQVSMQLSRFPAVGSPGFFGFVSGYLVPIGSASLAP